VDVDTDIDVLEDKTKSLRGLTKSKYTSGERKSLISLILNIISRYISISVGSAIFVLISYVTGIYGLIILATISITITLASYLKGLDILLRGLPTKKFEEVNEIDEIFKEVCRENNINPENYERKVISSNTPIAFIQLSLNKKSLFISTTLIEKLTREELKSVFKHELGHSYTSSYLFLLISLFSISITISSVFLFYIGISGINLFIALLIIGITSNIISNYLMWNEEKKADNFIGNELEEPLTRALVKIKKESYHIKSKVGQKLHVLLDPHPPLNKRAKFTLVEETDFPKTNIRDITQPIVQIIISVSISLTLLSPLIDWINPSIMLVAYFSLIVFTLIEYKFKNKTSLIDRIKRDMIIIISIIGLIIAFIIGYTTTLILNIETTILSTIGIGFLTILLIISVLPLLFLLLNKTEFNENPQLRTFSFSTIEKKEKE
jgi:Zn-dependent protease with chaperone function